MRTEHTEILIIGAGPAGAVAAGLLRKQGRQVLMIEKQQFPRFSIGESLLPQSMEYIEAAGMLRDVVEAGFQHKNGAAFAWRDRYADFDFRDKTSIGWGTTYQVQRADFDKLLADAAERAGAEVRYGHEVVAVDISGMTPRALVRSPDGEGYAIEARFMLDASGFGRVLPRLLDLETPSGFPVRGAIFTHVQDGIPTSIDVASTSDAHGADRACGAAGQPDEHDPDANGTREPRRFDRSKILVTVHPRHNDVWYWTIPLSGGRCSIGVVAQADFLDGYEGTDTQRLAALVAEDPGLSRLLRDAQWDTPARHMSGYSANVKSLWGRGYALLGNAGEFLDPVFSSGVTIALKSASLAADCLRREFSGARVDWDVEYAKPLKAGVDTFRAYVEAWYSGAFREILFRERQQPKIRTMVSSVLAGYAWDRGNPFAADARRRLRVLEQLCNEQPLEPDPVPHPAFDPILE